MVVYKSSTAFRKKVYTVRPELVEGHEIRFDKLSANGRGYKTCLHIYETLYQAWPNETVEKFQTTSALGVIQGYKRLRI